MSELTIIKAMKKDLELMLDREDKRDIYDEQLRREHHDELEEVKALVLAVTAPTQKLADECVEIGELIARRLTLQEVEDCKQVAEEMLEENRQETESKYAINGDETFEEI